VAPYQINVFSLDQLHGFVPDCISRWSAETINAMKKEQLQSLDDLQCYGFSDQVSLFTNETLANFRLSQLGNFSNVAIHEFTSQQLYVLFEEYDLSFVTLYNQPQTMNIEEQTIGEFKAYFDQNSGIISGFIDPEFPIIQNLSTIQWLIMAFVKDVAISTILTPDTMSSLEPSAIYGLRVDHVKRLRAKVFGQITPKQTSYLLYDTIGIMSGDQWAAISPLAFANLQILQIQNISEEAIPFLTVSQLNAISCDALKNNNTFTSSQMEKMSDSQTEALSQKKYECLNPSSSPEDTRLFTYITIGAGALILLIVLIMLLVQHFKRREYVPIPTIRYYDR